MKSLSYIILCAILSFTLSSCKENKKGKNYNSLTLVDKQALDFIVNGIESGRTEIQAANIALKNSTNKRVIALAEKIIDDNTHAVNQLKQIASEKNVLTGNVIGPENKKLISGLEGKLGADFDKAFIAMVIPHHQQTISLYQGVEHNTSGKIQALSKKTLPLLQQHLDSARQINADLQ